MLRLQGYQKRISLLDPYCRVCFVDRCLSFCAFLLAIGLSTRLHCTDSDYLIDIAKLFSKKDGYYNIKNDKRTNHDMQNFTPKNKDPVTWAPLTISVELERSAREAVPVPQLVLVMLALALHR